MTNSMAPIPLGDVVILSQGLAINAKTKHLLSDEGIPLLRITDLINGSFSQFVTKDLAPEKCLVESGEIVYTRTGQVGLVFNKFSGVAHNNCFKVIPDESILDRNFLYWFLRQPHIREYANSIASGSVQKDLNHTSFKSIEILIPERNHQRQVSALLDIIERKIELNQKMNQTLEDIAKAIFKSWFVDFDPVRAKAEGRPTGLPPEISDLFPDELVDSEIGEIPKGWDCKRVEAFADALLGGTPSRKKSNYWGGKIPWINSGAVNEFRIIEPSEYITQEGFDKSSTKLLPAKTTVIAITGATLGQVSYLEIDSCANQSVVGVIPHNNRAYEWTYLTFTEHIDRLISRQTGGAQQHINKNDVLDFDVVYPTNALIARFSDIASPLFVRIGVAVRENLILSELRDTLLPKLISGELRIPDAEKFLEEAGI